MYIIYGQLRIQNFYLGWEVVGGQIGRFLVFIYIQICFKNYAACENCLISGHIQVKYASKIAQRGKNFDLRTYKDQTWVELENNAAGENFWTSDLQIANCAVKTRSQTEKDVFTCTAQKAHTGN